MHHPILLTKTTSPRRTSPGTWPNDNKAIAAARFPALIAGLLSAASILGRRIELPLLFLGAGLLLIRPCASQSGTSNGASYATAGGGWWLYF